MPPQMFACGVLVLGLFISGQFSVFRGFMQFLSTTGFVTNSSPEEEIKQIPIRQDTLPRGHSRAVFTTYVHSVLWYCNFFSPRHFTCKRLPTPTHNQIFSSLVCQRNHYLTIYLFHSQIEILSLMLQIQLYIHDVNSCAY
jgi:hypothetical protein